MLSSVPYSRWTDFGFFYAEHTGGYQLGGCEGFGSGRTRDQDAPYATNWILSTARGATGAVSLAWRTGPDEVQGYELGSTGK